MTTQALSNQAVVSLNKSVSNQISRELLAVINDINNEDLNENKINGLIQLLEAAQETFIEKNLSHDLFEKCNDLREKSLLRKSAEDALKRTFKEERKRLSAFDKLAKTLFKALGCFEDCYTQGIGEHIRAEYRENCADSKSIFDYCGLYIYAKPQYNIQLAEGCTLDDVPATFLKISIDEQKVIEHMEANGFPIEGLEVTSYETFTKMVKK